MEKVTVKMGNLDVKTDGEKKKLGLQPMAAKLPKNTGGTPIAITTNLKQIQLAANIPIHKYDVNIKVFYKKTDGTETAFEISKSPKKGVAHQIDKKRCGKIYSMAAGQVPPLKNATVYYDQQASLYSFQQLTHKEDIHVTLTKGVTDIPEFVKAVFELKTVASTYQATTNDLKNIVNLKPALEDKTLLEALSMFMSAPALANPNVLTIGNCVHYLLNDTSSKFLTNLSFKEGDRSGLLGVSKSVKCLEGPGKEPCLYLTTDMTIALFQSKKDTTLLEVMRTHADFKETLHPSNGRRITAMFKGTYCFLNYGKRKNFGDDRPVFEIKQFGLSPREMTFRANEGEAVTTVEKYFAERYNIVLQWPNVMCANVKGKNGLMSIPAELLVICPGQKVTNDQMTVKEQGEVVKQAAARPHDRMNQTETAAKKMGVNGSSGAIKLGETVKLQGKVIETPTITFAGNRNADLNAPNARVPTDFRGAGHFFIAAQLQKWTIFYNEGAEARGFKDAFLKKMSQNGMRVAEPQVAFLKSNDRPYINSIFTNAKKAGNQLLVFILPELVHIHEMIKAMEQCHDMLTQEIKLEVATGVKSVTLQNIVNKTNMKLGGLNYLVSTPAMNASSKALIIGLETSKNGGSGEGPVSIGFAANIMGHYQQYAGGYMYVKKSSDLYGAALAEIVGMILNKITSPPSEIIVYINGVSSGQYALINEEYYATIKAACQKKRASFDPPVTIIAVSKTHSERFYQENQNGVSNLPPGTLVNHTVVSPVLNEFYLCSAVARQGTAKLAKYTIIRVNKDEKDLKRLENLTYDLAFDHQIVFQPIGLPAPLCVAGRCSERGAAVLGIRGVIKDEHGDINYKGMNDSYGYGKKQLFGTRFNA